jgi:hypothetical protein
MRILSCKKKKSTGFCIIFFQGGRAPLAHCLVDGHAAGHGRIE